MTAQGREAEFGEQVVKADHLEVCGHAASFINRQCVQIIKVGFLICHVRDVNLNKLLCVTKCNPLSVI